MKTRLFFNELSMDDWICDKNESKLVINDFINTLLELTKKGAEKSLCHPAGLITISLGNSYSISNWLDDSANDIELKRFVKIILTKTPFFENYEHNDECADISVHYKEIKTKGMLYCYIYNGLSISLLSSNEWDVTEIPVTVTSITDNADIIENDDISRNVAKIDHIKKFESLLEENLLFNIKNGRDLNDLSKSAFPNIVLCDNVILQIDAIRNNDPHLVHILRILSLLNKYLNNWNEEQFDLTALGISAAPDSEATMKKYPEERTFVCPDGETRAFTYHTNVSPGAWRLYFHPIYKTKTIYIGYIGKHLSTVKYKC